MLYRILLNGTDILDYSQKDLTLISPRLSYELDVAGSLEFIVPPTHRYYDNFTVETVMNQTIEVYEDDVLHWYGRSIELETDFYKQKKIYCEGAFAFFNDTVMGEMEFDETSIISIFSAVIANHNSQVAAARQFTVGTVTIPDKSVYRKISYETTFDILKNKFLDAEEGHFFFRRESGVNYIDWLVDMPYSCNQPVKFAENMLNYRYSFDGKDFATCVIPLGANDEEGKPITISSVNNDSEILVGRAAQTYGNIIKVQNYSDIREPYELLAEGQKYLNNLLYNAVIIECSAAELHSGNPNKELFRVGQTVECYSIPHSIRTKLPLSKIEINLDTAVKQITLGIIPKKTLARFYKEITGGNGSSSGNEEEENSEWALIPPDEDGGNPTMKKVPVRIQIVNTPYVTSYSASEEPGTTKYFQIDGIQVYALATSLPNITYFTDARYPTGLIPESELSFSYQIGGTLTPLPIGTDITAIEQSQIMVWVWWTCPYNGKKHGQAFYITNADQAAIDENMKAHHITIDVPPIRDHYIDGETIDFRGIVVKAYYEDGKPYDREGYRGGYVPNSELIFPVTKANAAMANVIHLRQSLVPNALSSRVAVTVSITNYVEYKTLRLGNGGRIEHGYWTKFTISEPVRVVMMDSTQNNVSFGYWFVADHPFTVQSMYAFKRQWNIDWEWVNSNNPSNVTVNSYTYQGKTVYYCNSLGVYNSGPTGAFETNVPTINYYGADFLIQPSAWAIMYDEGEAQVGQEIPVQWPRPGDAEVLEDTFMIQVDATDISSEEGNSNSGSGGSGASGTFVGGF